MRLLGRVTSVVAVILLVHYVVDLVGASTGNETTKALIFATINAFTVVLTVPTWWESK